MGKSAKISPKAAKVKKAAGKSPKKRPRTELSPEAFKSRFMSICTQPSCLPYPEKGGRRPDLAISCKGWVRASFIDGKMQCYNKNVVISGFLAIHATQKNSIPREWKLEDQKAESWAKQMTNRLLHLLRDCSQAALQKPPAQWFRLITSGPVKEELPAASENGSEVGEDGEEEAAVSASEAEETTKTQLIPKHPIPKYELNYSYEMEQAYRTLYPRGKKEYTHTWAKPKPCLSEKPVLAAWPDGFQAIIAQRTCGETWPDLFKGEGASITELPKRTAKATAGKDPLWTGQFKDGQTTYLAWRCSRGWQVSLYKGTQGQQVCQLKPSGVMLAHADAGDGVPNLCVALMKELAGMYVYEQVSEGNLYAERDKLLPKHGLSKLDGSGASATPHVPKRPAAAKDAAKAATTTVSKRRAADTPQKKSTPSTEANEQEAPSDPVTWSSLGHRPFVGSLWDSSTSISDSD